MEHDPEQALEHDAAELKERIERLEGQIDDSREKADEIDDDERGRTSPQ